MATSMAHIPIKERPVAALFSYQIEGEWKDIVRREYEWGNVESPYPVKIVSRNMLGENETRFQTLAPFNSGQLLTTYVSEDQYSCFSLDETGQLRSIIGTEFQETMFSYLTNPDNHAPWWGKVPTRSQQIDEDPVVFTYVWSHCDASPNCVRVDYNDTTFPLAQQFQSFPDDPTKLESIESCFDNGEQSIFRFTRDPWTGLIDKVIVSSVGRYITMEINGWAGEFEDAYITLRSAPDSPEFGLTRLRVCSANAAEYCAAQF